MAETPDALRKWEFFDAHPSPSPGEHAVELHFLADGTVRTGCATDAPEALIARMEWLLDLLAHEPRLLSEICGVEGAARSCFGRYGRFRAP